MPHRTGEEPHAFLGARLVTSNHPDHALATAARVGGVRSKRFWNAASGGKAYFRLAMSDAFAQTPVLPEATFVGALSALLRRPRMGTKRWIMTTRMARGRSL